jgi:hypothetical protein
MSIPRASKRAPGAELRGTDVEQLDRRPKLDDFDRSLLNFVIQWRPYGGPRDEECLPLFGIRERDLPQRVQAIASAWLDRDMNLKDRVRIVRALAAVQSVVSRRASGKPPSEVSVTKPGEMI